MGDIRDVKPSCNSILFGGATTETALRLIAEAGFSAVELSATRGLAEHVSEAMSSDDITQLKSWLASNDLSASAVEMGGSSHDRLPRILAISSELGVSVVNISSGGVSGDEASFAEVAERIGEMANVARRYGIKLSVKPHVRHVVFDTSSALRLVEEVREPNLGLNFDPSHLYRAGEDPAEVVDMWGGFIVSSHFRDCETREQRVGTPETQVPGNGRIDLDATLAKLALVPNLTTLSLQIVGASDYPADVAAQLAADGYAYLHSRISTWQRSV